MLLALLANPGAAAKPVEKSRFLPRLTIRSALASTDANAPKLGSLRPRGLSIGMTGASRALARDEIRSPVRVVFIAGPVKTKGRAAVATALTMVLMVWSVGVKISAAQSIAVGTGTSPMSLFKRSNGSAIS